MKPDRDKYAVPQNAGLQSTDQACGKKLANLIDTLSTINENIFCNPGLPHCFYYSEENKGHSVSCDAQLFKVYLIEKLRAGGWEVCKHKSKEKTIVKRVK